MKKKPNWITVIILSLVSFFLGVMMSDNYFAQSGVYMFGGFILGIIGWTIFYKLFIKEDSK